MILTKLKSGHFAPVYPADLDEANKVKVGEEVKATRARNVGHHRKFFALLKLMFSNQDAIANEEVFRKLMIINTGRYDEVKNKDGVMIPIAHSISFEAMSQSDFEKLYDDMIDVAIVKLKTSKEEIQNELINFM